MVNGYTYICNCNFESKSDEEEKWDIALWDEDDYAIIDAEDNLK